jgi:hypothetical protein
MQFTVNETTANGIKLCGANHLGEELIIPTNGYSATKIAHAAHMWDECNAFMATLPEEDQDKLFQLYKSAHTTITDAFDIDETQHALSLVVTDIFNIITEKDILQFITRPGNLVFPPDLKTDYDTKDTWADNYEERTYLKPEYTHLVSLTMGFRFLVPIWGHYLQLTSLHSGNDFKEETAAYLIDNSRIVTWQGYERLLRYIQYTAGEIGSSLSLVMSGLSSTEIPNYLASLTIVRRLSTTPITYRSDSDHIVKTIYNFVRQTTDRLNKGLSAKVDAKRPRGELFEDDNSSVLDKHRQSQDVSDGILMIAEIYTENPRTMVEKLLPDKVSDKLLKDCITRANKLVAENPEYITDMHLSITAWMFKGTISPDSFRTLSVSGAQPRCIGVAQAVLIESGFERLGMLLTAAPVCLDTHPEYVTAYANNRITKKIANALGSLYPYYRRSTRKVDQDKVVNIATVAIDTIVETLNQYGWRSPTKWEKRYDAYLSGEQLIVGPDIKNELGRLILFLNDGLPSD